MTATKYSAVILRSNLAAGAVQHDLQIYLYLFLTGLRINIPYCILEKPQRLYGNVRRVMASFGF